ncbi:hypothetical protein SGPA1_11026 [Streptomyces misionensis JCM 4497]
MRVVLVSGGAGDGMTVAAAVPEGVAPARRSG